MTGHFFSTKRQEPKTKSQNYSLRMASISLPRTRSSMPNGGRKSDPCTIPPRAKILPPGRLTIFSGSNSVRLHGLPTIGRSEEHTAELQSRLHLGCRLLLGKKKKVKH